MLESKLETDVMFEDHLSSHHTTVHNQNWFDVHFRVGKLSVDDKKPVDVFVEINYSDATNGVELKESDLLNKCNEMKKMCEKLGLAEDDTVFCFLALREEIPTEDEVRRARGRRILVEVLWIAI
jgi:hypothetical protein